MIDIPSSLAVTGIKADYTIVSQKNYNNNLPLSSILFNGTVSTSDRVICGGSYYITIKVTEKVNIGVYGSAYSSAKTVKLIETSTNKTYTLPAPITSGQWGWKWFVFSNLPAGVYKLTASATDFYASEMYIESLAGGYVIKMDNNIYSAKQSNYDSDTQMYKSITDLTADNFINYSVQMKELFTEVTIGEETFKPIDKFNKFNLISDSNSVIKAKGRKINKQLVVASSSFSTKLAENIDYFKSTINITNLSTIKSAISIDEGQTWKTTNDNGVTWIDLDCTIPLKEYSDLTTDELTQWNDALTKIDTNGFNISDAENIDFNTIKDKTMMFAYVLYQDAYDSVCDNLSLKWQFDSKGKMDKMKDGDEVEISLLEDKVVIIPKIDNDMIKVNILNGVSDNNTSSEPSDTEIDNMVNEVINSVFA